MQHVLVVLRRPIYGYGKLVTLFQSVRAQEIEINEYKVK